MVVGNTEIALVAVQVISVLVALRQVVDRRRADVLEGIEEVEIDPAAGEVAREIHGRHSIRHAHVVAEAHLEVRNLIRHAESRVAARETEAEGRIARVETPRAVPRHVEEEGTQSVCSLQSSHSLRLTAPPRGRE